MDWVDGWGVRDGQWEVGVDVVGTIRADVMRV